MLVGLGAAGADEPGGGRCGPSHTHRAGYEFEQIESDIFVAASAKARVSERVHPEISLIVLRRDDASRPSGAAAPAADLVPRRGDSLDGMQTAYIGMGSNLASRAGPTRSDAGRGGLAPRVARARRSALFALFHRAGGLRRSAAFSQCGGRPRDRPRPACPARRSAPHRTGIWPRPLRRHSQRTAHAGFGYSGIRRLESQRAGP